MTKKQATAASESNAEVHSSKFKPIPLAVVGMGCLFPGADNTDALWSNIAAGVDAIKEVPSSHWNPDAYFDDDPKSPDMTYARRGAFLDPVQFNPMEFGIAPNAIEATDTTQLLGLIVARQALRDAGLDTPEAQSYRDRMACILGVTGTLELVLPLSARLGHPLWKEALSEAGVPADVAADVVERISQGYVPWQEASFPGLLGNVVAGRIANFFDMGGTNCVADAACGSSLAALNMATLELASGRCDVVVTGGMDTFNDIFMYMCFSKTPALSPTGDARPFSDKADGTILGEGLGAVVMKRLDDAERDGDKIYAVIESMGSSSDGKGTAIYAPKPAGQAKALRQAYKFADVTPEQIDLVEAHGTGTKAGDASEIESITSVFQKPEGRRPWCALGSIKSQIGHAKAAAGAAGLMKIVLALHHKTLPPTIKVDQPAEPLADEKTALYVNTIKRPWLPREGQPRRAAVSAFGFGGSNFHCLAREYQAEKSCVDWGEGDAEIFAYSGDCAADIEKQLSSLDTDAAWKALRVEAARSRRDFSPGAHCRLVMTGERSKDFSAQVEKARKALKDKADAESWSLPSGIYYATGQPEGKTAFLFPGQGGTRAYMLDDLACRFPEVLDALTVADKVFAEEHGEDFDERLSDKIYPRPMFDKAAKEAAELALRATEVAQPAIGALSWGSLGVLRRFGIDADASVGHSYGELVALASAGRIDGEAFQKMSVVRGKLMAGDRSDKGGMIAVRTDAVIAQEVIDSEKLDLIVANKNAPNQTILSGSTDAIDAAEHAFNERDIRATCLNVSAAFHSEAMADAREPFLAALDDIRVSRADKTVMSNVSGDAYPASAKATRQLMADQICSPVEFIANIEKLYEDGVRTFIEVGPGSTLSGLVKSILGKRPAVCLALDSSRGKRPGLTDLAMLLSELAALGHNVNLAAWDPIEIPEATDEKRPALTVEICGANYRKPYEKKPKAAPRPMAAASPQAAPVPAAPSSDISRALADAMQATQTNMAALQQIQEQTANLHRQYLEGQESAQQSLQALIAQQQQMVQSGIGSQPVMPAPIQPVAPPAAPQVDTGRIREALLSVIAEKTGYPAEMLDDDMGLDADLGIDSIKRVEILSAIQEKLPEAPVIGPEHLGTLQTLGQIIDFLSDGAPAATSPAPAATAEATAAPAASGADSSQVREALLSVIAEKTGYPAEMLDDDMGLDADLGIDSIKRVEILSAIQEKLPEAPVIGPEHLGTLQTLGQIIEFLSAGAPSAPAEAPAPATDSGQARQVLLSVIAEKTGYPPEMLEDDMGLDADLGIDSIKRVEILSAIQEQLPEAPVIGPEHLGTLQTLGQISEFLSGTNGKSPAPAAPVPDEASASPEPIQEVETKINRAVLTTVTVSDAREALSLTPESTVWIVNDGSKLAWNIRESIIKRKLRAKLITWREVKSQDVPADLSGLIIPAPEDVADDKFLLEAFLIAQKAEQVLRQTKSVCVTVSRMDGRFGLDNLNDSHLALSGGLAGLAKTAGHEWPEVHCKAIDIAPAFAESPEGIEALIEEIMMVGPSEVGLSENGAVALCLEAIDNTAAPRKNVLDPGDVVVVTGGARGVTAQTVRALAAEWSPSFVLVGRSPLPQDEPEYLAGLTEEAEIKRAIMENADGKITPREVGDQYSAIANAREIRANLDAIREVGAKRVEYRSLDIRDGEAVAALIDEIRSDMGPIRGFIHGAGVLADKSIADKTPEQFQRVFETKVHGLRAFMNAMRDDALKVIALFSSSTGRFGRAGQVDYAVANEILNKTARAEARRRPGCRVFSFNWGPWDGGMVTPSLARVFREEGLDLIPLEAGAQFLVDEIAAGLDDDVEVVVLAGADDLLTEQAAPDSQFTTDEPLSDLPFALNIQASVEAMPVLNDHVIGGKAVVPAALMVEWMAHGALHANPGFTCVGFNDFQVLKGVRLGPDDAQTIDIHAAGAVKIADGFSVQCQLRSTAPDGRVIPHARMEVILANGYAAPPEIAKAENLGQWSSDRTPYDPDLLFHGPLLQCLEVIDGLSTDAIAARCSTKARPGDWIAAPLRGNWIHQPLALDGAFQLLVLWTEGNMGQLSLPTGVGRFRQFDRNFPNERVSVEAKVKSRTAHGAVSDIVFRNTESGRVVALIEDYQCVLDASLRDAFAQNQLAAPSA